jgi:hypothetical protein
MASQPRMLMAPRTNIEGALRGREQLRRLRDPDWSVEYDRERDTLYLRARDDGPAVSYFEPACPEVMYRLDLYSGELNGIDLERFRSVLVKTSPAMARLFREYRRLRLLASIPGLRWLQDVLNRDVPALAGDQLMGAFPATAP